MVVVAAPALVEGVAVRGVGGVVSVRAETGVEWRLAERRSDCLVDLAWEPFLEAVEGILDLSQDGLDQDAGCRHGADRNLRWGCATMPGLFAMLYCYYRSQNSIVSALLQDFLFLPTIVTQTDINM